MSNHVLGVSQLFSTLLLALSISRCPGYKQGHGPPTPQSLTVAIGTNFMYLILPPPPPLLLTHTVPDDDPCELQIECAACLPVRDGDG